MTSYLAHSTGDHRAPNALARAPNNESLEAEFERAVQIEEHKKNVNDAKLRAVAQRVPTYDDFHQMVLGADLKPMAKKDRGKVSLLEGIRSDTRGQFFGNGQYAAPTPDLGFVGVTDRGTGGEADGLGSGGDDGWAGGKQLADKPPENAMAFTREWRRCCDTAERRSRYLSIMPGETEWWANCFKTAIDVTILAQIVTSWEGAVGQDGAAALVGQAAACCLVGLGRTERYELTLDLLSPQEVEVLRSLCSQLAVALGEAGDDATLLAELREGCYQKYFVDEDVALSAME